MKKHTLLIALIAGAVSYSLAPSARGAETDPPPGIPVTTCDQSPAINDTTSLTLDCGSKPQAGQVAVADVLTYGGSAPTIAPPEGWTLIRDDSSPSTRQSLYWHVVEPNEPNNETWTFSQPVDAQGVVVLLDGVEGTDPIDASSGNPGHSGTLTADSALTSSSGDVVVAFYATDFQGVGPGHNKPQNMNIILDQEDTPGEFWILAGFRNSSGETGEATCATPQLFNWVAAQVAFKSGTKTASR